MKLFTVNGKQYPQKEFSFGMLCDFEEMGLTIENMEKIPLSFVRAYVANCMGVTKEEAGAEIDAHFANGGDLDSIMDALKSSIDESGFFQAINKGKKTGDPESETNSKKA